MKTALKNRMAGASLIEMMIAMALGLLITAGVISVFLSVKQTYSQNERSARIQENGRIALFLLTKDLRHAGFWGPMLNIDHSTRPDLPDTPLTGPCASWAGSKTTLLNNRFVASTAPASTTVFNSSCLTASGIKSNTSAVAIKRVHEQPTAYSSLAAGQVFLRAHSSNAQFFAKGVGDGADPTPVGWQDWAYEPVLYYIRTYAETPTEDPLIPTLCRVSLSTASKTTLVEQCLVTGVDDLYIEYGLDTSGHSVPSVYKASPTVTEILNTVAIKIHILVRDTMELDPAYTDSKTYTLGSKTVGPFNDNYRRAVFSTTVIPHNQRYLPIK